MEGECFGACGDAPVVIVNNKRMLVGMTAERIDATLAELGNENVASAVRARRLWPGRDHPQGLTGENWRLEDYEARGGYRR